MVIIGNKCDLESERQVSRHEGQELAKQFKCPFMEASAKHRVNVEECFFDLVREIRRDVAPAAFANSGSHLKQGGGGKKMLDNMKSKMNFGKTVKMGLSRKANQECRLM